MSERFAFYRCETCGNLVQVFISGEGELVCCGKPMTLLQPHKNDEFANEKHVPVFLEDSESGETKIQVGAIPHPMEACSKETKVAVAILDQPVEWNDKHEEVQIIFMISIN